MSEKKEMTLVDHLTELRKRIIWSLVVFVLAVIIGLWASSYVIDYLKEVPPASSVEWHAFSPWDGIRIYMQFAFAIALVISLPFLLYQLWAFVKPGLRVQEQRASLNYIPFAFLLFLVGLSFAYFFVFPMAFYFTTVLTNQLNLQQTYGATQYFAFMFNLLLPISLLFELPVVVMFLTKLRLLNPKRMHKMRRVAYLILLVIGAVVTPPDVVSAVLVTIPLIGLYELSVWLSGRIYNKQMESDRVWEAEYGKK